MKRRHFLTSTSAAILTAGVLSQSSVRHAFAQGQTPRTRLAMPPLLDTRETGRVALTATPGSTAFGGGASTPTAGYNQGYLGPTVVMQNGDLAAEVQNNLDEAITTHWHGLLVPGEHDGGPQQAIEPGASWTPDLTIAQDPATVWYHTHMHGRIPEQVYFGLAGVIHLTDGQDDARGLPSTYGIDDLTLVLQDRRFDRSGRMIYDPSMMDIMHGFAGNRMLINGQAGATAVVPEGIVRLRLLNGSNARIYTLFMDDTRPMHLVATDGGFLPAPVALDALRLSPGERAEVLVDFSSGGAPVLMSDPGQAYGVLQFATDSTLSARITHLPDQLDGAPEDLSGAEAVTRQVSLDMGMGGMMMGGGGFAINGRPFDMRRIDFEVALGSVERWQIRSTMVAHPFHVHGVRFRVITENGGPPRPENTGWKDTVLVPGEAEILARFDQPASRETPFMFHCHILEHEDAGMMGQFTVT
ncbi:FtsP/CotA-like multicopper oxidase with cupredoxin domain [Devosia subaequoris]|uniref:FtsP/CotA-like multicopper oxidase with cupredoxin domain n=1 Tax=Devosia subaequoris TaxID=395930 RepID=A0A7W6IPY5_9HYPH|nr:multicopper oxidase domain-containing protein [Devosia subaequoris]MBB4053610.1 FtsP/CotA-like multicopper oxidase with cupredoxin domain [Devosia subaequoris]MCP1211253.1 multicopper oxidase domain-containing protein [Devosia subaequoris]